MKILLIDDEPSVRRSLRRILEQTGNEVKEASDGQEGYELWCQWHPDLVFLDMMMPQKNGIQVLQAEPPKAHVILISAFSGEMVAQHKEMMMKYRLLKKPFEGIEQILKVVKEVVKNV